MFGEVEGSRSVTPTSTRLGRHRRRRANSTRHILPNRTCSNSLKTKDGCHVYSTLNPEHKFTDDESHSFFPMPDRSKLPRESSGQESRSR